MICDSCGTQMNTNKEAYLYEECGLDGITLVGVEVSRCANCGNYEVAIPRIEQLHTAIARSLARKKAKLMPQEIRFLRKYLGFSGADFARTMGTTPETVSRWEHGKSRMTPVAERALRLMIFVKKPIEEYPPERLAEVATGKPAVLKMRFLEGGNGWRSQDPIPLPA